MHRAPTESAAHRRRGWYGALLAVALVGSALAIATPAEAIPFNLTVTTAGTGTTPNSARGTVRTTPVGTPTLLCRRTTDANLVVVDNVGTCTALYGFPAVVEVRAHPDNPVTAASLSGGGCDHDYGAPGEDVTCTVTMNQARSVTATFLSPAQAPLTVTTAGTTSANTTSGRVTSDPAGISCRRVPDAVDSALMRDDQGDCSETFPSGTEVTLTATPLVTGGTAALSGDCEAGPGLPDQSLSCTVTMGQARAVTATFSNPAQQFGLSVATEGVDGTGLSGEPATAQGRVSSAPSGISCSREPDTASPGNPVVNNRGTCSKSFTSGTTVTLTATPVSTQLAAQLTGGGCDTAQGGPGASVTCTVSMDRARSVRALFTSPPQLIVTALIFSENAASLGQVIDQSGSCDASLAGTTCATLSSWAGTQYQTYSAMIVPADEATNAEVIGGPCDGLIGAPGETLTCSFTPDRTTTYSVVFHHPGADTRPVLVLDAAATTRAYGDPNGRLYTLTGFTGGDTEATSDLTGTPACATDATLTTNASTTPHPITCTRGTLASAKYRIQTGDLSGALTVTKAVVTVKTDDLTREYGTSGLFPVSYLGLKNGDTEDVISGNIICLSPGIAASVSGSPYVITCYSTDMSATNYTFRFAPGLLTVTKAPLALKAVDLRREYGLANPEPGITADGFKLNDTTATALTGSPSCSTTATPASDVGQYPITCTLGTLQAANYSLGSTITAGTMTVAPAPLTMHIADLTREYGDPVFPRVVLVDVAHAAAPSDVIQWSVTGFRNGDTSALLTGMMQCEIIDPDQRAAVGVVRFPLFERVYPAVTCHFQVIDLGPNYFRAPDDRGVFGLPAADVIVTRAPLTVVADDTSREYGMPDPTFTTTISGFKLDDTSDVVSGAAACSTTATLRAPAGTTAPITCDVGSLDASNYSFSTFTPGTLTVTQAPLTIKADDATRRYGETNPAFTADYTGFRIGDGPAQLGGVLSLFTGADLLSAPGTYPITPSGSTSSNYAITFVPGILTITKGLSSTALTANPNPAGYGSPVTLTAQVAGAGVSPTGTVTFRNGTTVLGTGTVATNGRATLSTTLSAGTQDLSATYNGDSRYESSTGTLSLPVNKATTRLVLASLADNKFHPTATLFRGTNTPVVGVLVRFVVDGSQVCTAVTNTRGVATCSATVVKPGKAPKGVKPPTVVYQGFFDGDANHLPSSAAGTVP